MKERNGRIALLTLCLILGLVISMQIQAVKNSSDSGVASTQKVQQLSLQLKDLREEKEQLNNELTELEDRLTEYQLSEADENVIINNLRNDLNNYQLYAGFQPAIGPGVTIEINDPVHEFSTDESIIMYYYDVALLEPINKLNAAGAEAISINGQRYTANTEIYYTSNGIQINGVTTKAPYVIKAIGNPDTLEAALNMRWGIVWELKEGYGITVDITKEDLIEIPRLGKIFNYEYAKPLQQEGQN
ncbi:DUF881 domain-containing protein [Serpentinicella sp. ANB-PHB4]|uniref:DUF881 domain-containing protein n=1 Tax=Serpentinicella sp. ANB-PHB4 TaxID=3074076 RepID=UPI002855C5B0|nr:DUF881 domain-containing protein [Serpentinicella sp. ANB-PHB4]MDR5658035.1 DUF881 domain-containing protein [Serpentinicella sp. ANB-PHB4]